MERAHVYISGLVQGVNFRSATRSKALELGLKGWVKNLSDGRVEAVFEGDAKKIEEVLRWCHIGPPHARVTNVKVVQESLTEECKSFEVRY